MITPFKFRAKEVKTGEWVEGDLHLLCRVPHIHTDPTHKYAIDTDTICVFFGLKDKNKKEIYDGDIIASGKNNEIKHVIAYNDTEARYVGYYSKIDYCGVSQKWINEFNKVIIGNKYDNPELVK